MKWKNNFYKNVFFKKCCNFSNLDDLNFQTYVDKSVIYFIVKMLIPDVALTSVIRRNMYGRSFLWSTGLIFK